MTLLPDLNNYLSAALKILNNNTFNEADLTIAVLV